MLARPSLILLPGLGADTRLFEPQRAAFPDLIVPPWLPHQPDETLASYARRMAAPLAEKLAASRSAGEPFFLGGASFGGMVAQEMAQYLAPRGVLLIASCRTGQAVARHLHYFVEFAHLFPQRTFAPGRGLSRLYAGKWGSLSPVQQQFLEQVLARVDPGFTRWAIAAATAWPGLPEPLPVPIHQIHGSEDRFIPAEGVSPEVMIPGAGHLINVTHAGEVNAFIAEKLRS